MNTITVNNTELKIKEYNGQRVVTFVDIDNVHKRPKGTAGRNFRSNKKKMIENTDYYKVQSDVFRRFGNNADYSYPKGGFLLTESGYLMIVKSLNDDLSWEIQRMLVNTYFQAKEAAEQNLPVIAEPRQSTPEVLNILDKFLDVQIKIMEQERENNREMREMLKENNAELRGMVKDLLGIIMEGRSQPAPIVIQNSETMPYEDYKREVNKACNAIVDLKAGKYRDKNSCLHEAYERIRKEYGIVYEQEKKDFFNEVGRSAVSTLELQWYVESTKPTYKNLLLSKLNTIYNECKGEKK